MDIPEPKGKYVTLSHYFDVSLNHDMVTGILVTAILHFLNQTPMDWYLKKQATIETDTFGSEFIAARTTINQIVDLRMIFVIQVFLFEKRATSLGTTRLLSMPR